MIMETGSILFDSIVILEYDSDSDEVPDRLDAFPTERTQSPMMMVMVIIQ